MIQVCFEMQLLMANDVNRVRAGAVKRKKQDSHGWLESRATKNIQHNIINLNNM